MPIPPALRLSAPLRLLATPSSQQPPTILRMNLPTPARPEPPAASRSDARATLWRVRAVVLCSIAGLVGGVLAGWAIDRHQLIDRRRAVVVDGSAVSARLVLAQRGLLAALVQGPMDVESSIAEARADLSEIQDWLNSLAGSARTPESRLLSETARRDLGELTGTADLYMASLRRGDFTASLRLATAFGTTVVDPARNASDDPLAKTIEQLADAIAAEQDAGLDGRVAFGALGCLIVAISTEARRRRRRSRSRIRLSKLASELELVEPSIIVLNRLGHIETITAGAIEMLRSDHSAGPGVSLVGAAGPEFAALAVATGATSPIDVTMSRAGRLRHLQASTPVAAEDGQALLWVLRDVTEARSREGELTRKAFHDPLTLLANREHFRHLVQETLETVSASELSVLFVDLDGFKQVNDSFGHEVGDQLLVDVTHRLQEIVHASDLIGRLGGDEFALLLRSTRPRYAEVIAEQIVHELAEPFIIDGRTMRIGGSVGYTSVAEDSSVEELLQQADVAMYAAKEMGKGRTSRFEAEMLAANRRRIAFERELHGVASSGQLRLLYQPVVDLATRRMVGMEALVRWQHPERGLVSPLEFITAAEANGSIVDIGRWVLRTGLTEFGRLPASYGLRLNVNVSPRQLGEPDFAEIVAAEIERSGVDPSIVTLEVTESLLLGDVEKSIEQLHALKALGVQLALDDFGTGYSSLSYLSRLPVDIVKIDKSFVDELVPDQRPGDPTPSSPRHEFIGALVALAHACDLRVVAEGVEHEYQVEQLRRLGCEYGQGYLFARPLPASSLAAAIAPPAMPETAEAITGAGSDNATEPFSLFESQA